MTTPAREPAPKLPTPTVEEIQAAIDFLSGTVSEDEFAQHLADMIMADPRDPETLADLYGQDSPDPIPLAAAQIAFRGPYLATRSYAAAKLLTDKTKIIIETAAPKEGLSRNQARRHRLEFMARVSQERRLLKIAMDGFLAQKGVVRSAPNARGRAMRELKQLHLREFQALTRKHERIIKAEDEQKKVERRAAAAKRKAVAKAAARASERR
jgi:hypothetical protein